MSVRDAIIQRRFEEVGETLVSGNTDRIAGLFTRDSRLLPPDGGLVTGERAIVRFWQGVREMGAESVDVETMAVEDHQSVVIRIGLATFADTDGTTLDRVKFIEIWKREDGTWKIGYDIWNSNLYRG